MNTFDWTILSFLNRFARRSWLLDHFAGSLVGNSLFKGGLIIAVLWGLWFIGRDREQEEIRKSIIVTFVGTFAGLFVTRVLVNILPFRPRPIHNGALHFVLPYGVSEETLKDYGMSFPSDHATLFFGLAAGILLISRRWGILAFAYLLFTTFLLRVYHGYHHPTDIIVGAFIGVASVMLANTSFVRERVVDRIFDLSQARPGLFYGFSFVVSYQCATLFHDSRKFVIQAVKLLKIAAAHLT